MSIENLPHAIQWSEGMLLAPQHFQQVNTRQEALLHYHLMTIAPFHWGIQKLKIDESLLLQDGTFRVSELEAIMPDGLVVRYPDGKNDLQISLKDHKEDMKKTPVAIHLAVPAKRTGAAYAKGILPRYDSVEGETVPDENTGESGLAIPRLLPRVTLLAAEMPEPKYCSFPLAKVEYKDETFKLTDFIPPLLKVSRGSDVGEMCASVGQELREKAVFLSEKINAEDSPSRETKLSFRSIVSALPQFEAVLKTGVTHPYLLYVSLSALLGNLASIGFGKVPPVLDQYNHNDLRVTFEPVLKFISDMITEGIRESHTVHKFTFENRTFKLKLREEWATRQLIIGVRGKPGMREQDVSLWMERKCQIGSVSKVQSIEARRILGAVPREKIEKDEDLVPPKGTVLFAVTVKPEKEERFVVPGEELHIFSPSGAIPSEIVLYVRNRN